MFQQQAEFPREPFAAAWENDFLVGPDGAGRSLWSPAPSVTPSQAALLLAKAVISIRNAPFACYVFKVTESPMFSGRVTL